MPLCLTPRIERIAQTVTGRQVGLFAKDVQAATAVLRERLEGKRVLLVGAAGSIGSATLIEMLAVARPAVVAVLDPNENNLAELVRSVRNLTPPFLGELIVQPLDYGSPLAAIFLDQHPAFDVIFSFAALKHVRSERDHFSTLRLLEVNLLKADAFLAAVRRRKEHGRAAVFFVSTDKAANPIGIMGASKRAMELLLWAHTHDQGAVHHPLAGAAACLTHATTARFANVAFSDGSLPWAFLQRLEKQQPLAAPGDIRRYLVTPSEAGQLCLLAGAATPSGHVVVPNLDPARDMASFVDIATATLREFGLVPTIFNDPAQALASVASERKRGHYPVLVTTSDTSGEKEVEEFIADGEEALPHPAALARLSVIAAPARTDLVPLRRLLALVDQAVHARSAQDVPDKVMLATALAAVVPGFHHRETGKSLDGKM